jgi:hypothetical protein
MAPAEATMTRLLMAFVAGFVAGWWRREDPFITHYAWSPPRVGSEIYGEPRERLDVPGAIDSTGFSEGVI